jgi:hypothetical protein
MASIAELVRLVNEGETGKLLAKTFHGERGSANPCEDSDVLVVFPSEAQTPEAKDIARVVTDHYTRKGYVVERNKHEGADCFEVLIFAEEKFNGAVAITITTKYPFPAPGQGRASLRLCSHITSP